MADDEHEYPTPANPPDPKPRKAKRQPRKKGQGPIPRRQDNGYYADHETGERLRSVTTILGGGVPKPALMFWAANTCTDAAIQALPQLVAASRNRARLAELRDWITRAHTRKKDERADVGSAVHAIIEAQVLGEPMPDTIVLGKGTDHEQTLRLDGPELSPFVDNFAAFLKEWEPEFRASEMVVANPDDQYAGTLDYIVRSPKIVAAINALTYKGKNLLETWGIEPLAPDADLMGDTKTGGDWDRVTSAGHVHGVYPEVGLQMSAYRHATMCWLRDGQRVPMPPTAEVGIVLHLRPEGYRIYPARCTAELYTYFRHAQMIDDFSSKVASAKPREGAPVIGGALKPPTRRRTRKSQ